MIKFLTNKNKGFTLVETLVAISIFSISIVAVMSVLGSGISDTNYAKNKLIASYLAQEGIEYARNFRDNDTLNGSTWGNLQIDMIPPSFDSNFQRIVSTNVSLTNANEIKVSSTVCWQPANCDTAKYKVVLSENLFNWVE
ncbi:MAG: type II secretion system protein [Candidatus Paceibacterota bacterium]